MSDRIVLDQEGQKQVIALIPYAKKIAKRHHGFVDLEEAEGIALIHLCMAVPSYVPGKQTLKSFVGQSVRRAVTRAVERQIYEQDLGLSGGAATTSQITGCTAAGRLTEPRSEGRQRDLDADLGTDDKDPVEATLWSELFNILPKDLRAFAYEKWCERRTEHEIAQRAGVSRDVVHRKIVKAEGFAKLYLNGGAA